MANTRMSAKNGFQEGLVLDLSPTNSSANSLSSALNATLITYNGNEMSLLNDMGNARVETAFLPEGYVPVGTCEFGDIIYVVSYNPIINKSLIGCFPSPERNISTEEIGAAMLTLSWKDFQGGSDKPDGTIKTTSVKKILYGNRYMHSGDKYIIYSNNIDSASQSLSDYGNTSHVHGSFPKFVKIHVVSIEDSGKIVYLDSSTKWYDNNYYVKYDLELKMEEFNTDIDSHRDLVSSAYSVFNSKVSGKLALLIELEKINGFSCAWKADVRKENNNNIYDIKLLVNWTANDKNVTPKYVCIDSSTPVMKQKRWKYNSDKKLYIYGDDKADIIPNKYKYDYEFSRHYRPEISSYLYDSEKSNDKTFSNWYNYDTFEKNLLKAIKLNYSEKSWENLNLEELEQELNSITISKVFKASDGKYYFNCDIYNKELDIEEWHYYTFLNGKLEKLIGLLKNLLIDGLFITDTFINNTFNYPIDINYNTFTIPYLERVNNELKLLTNEGLIYHYRAVPAMPYGMLEEYALEGYIDFNRIGTKDIKLTSWKYYNYAGTSTLTWGMDAYCEPNKGIEEVVFEFFDNQGLAAAYHNYGKESYNGRFTEYITFNEPNTNYKLNNKDRNGGDIIHKGVEVIIDDSTNTDLLIKEGNKYYENDAGILYPNVVYLVRISVKYASINQLGSFNQSDVEWVDEYRWFWTNGLLNEYYSSILDYNTLKPELNFDVNAIYKAGDTLKNNKILYDPNLNTEVTKTAEELLKANIEYTTGDIEMSILAGLLNTYNTFNLYSGKNTEGEEEIESLTKINVNIGLGNEYINNSEDKPKLIFSDLELNITEGIYPINNLTTKPIVSTTLANLINNDDLYTKDGKEINHVDEDGTNYYNNYNNYFNLEFLNSISEDINNPEEKLEYIGYDQESKELKKAYRTTLSEIEYTENKHIKLKFNGIVFSKFMELVQSKTDLMTVIKPVLYNNDDLAKYNMKYQNGHFYLNTWALSFSRSKESPHHPFTIYKGSVGSEYTSVFTKDNTINMDETSTEAKLFSDNKLQSSIPDNAKGIALMYLVSEEDNDMLKIGNEYEIRLGDDDETGTLVKDVRPITGIPARWDSNKCKASTYTGPFEYNKYNATCHPFLTMKDVQGNVHVLNNMIPVSVDNGELSLKLEISTTHSRAITDNPNEDSPNDEHGGNPIVTRPENKYISYGTTIGDMIASLLMNIYSTTGASSEIPYKKIVNQVSLAKYNITYTKDIVIEVSTNNETDLLLLMSGIYFYNYKDELKKKFEEKVGDKEYEKVIENNVNITINPIIKNCPILFSFNYIIPNYFENLSYNCVTYCSNGDIIYTDLGIPANMMHYRLIDQNGFTSNLVRLDSQFIYKLCTNFKIENGQYIMDYNNSNVTNFTTLDSNFVNTFSLYNNEIRCSGSPDAKSRGLVYTVHGISSGKLSGDLAGLRKIDKTEALLFDLRYTSV